MPKILILNGPNLNFLGTREPEIYGKFSLAEVEEICREKAETIGLELDFKQSNSEGELIDYIQFSMDSTDGIIINPAAYTHTSVAILDALKQYKYPIIEVHLSNIYSREAFRNHSYVSPIAKGVICGFGAIGYELALDAMYRLISDKEDF